MPARVNGANLLLASLSPSVREAVLANSQVRSHPRGDQLYAQGEPVREIVYPLSGLVSLTVDTTEGQTIEVAVVGREGFVGAGRYLGRTKSDVNAMTQVAGDQLHIDADTMLEIARDGSVRTAFNRYVNSLLVEAAQSAVCNQVHSVEQRTARWLLHAADRAGTTDLALTHEFLSQMLAVRRASVTTVAGIFNRAGLTTARRGLISIVDPDGLSKLTCECYMVVRAATPTYD